MDRGKKREGKKGDGMIEFERFVERVDVKIFVLLEIPMEKGIEMVIRFWGVVG